MWFCVSGALDDFKDLNLAQRLLLSPMCLAPKPQTFGYELLIALFICFD